MGITDFMGTTQGDAVTILLGLLSFIIWIEKPWDITGEWISMVSLTRIHIRISNLMIFQS